MTPNEQVTVAANRVNRAYEELWAARREHRVALKRRAESGRQPGVCGTAAGYRRHQVEFEAPCWACLDAHSWYKTRRKS